MEKKNLNKASDALFNLLLQLNNKVFNQDKLVKCAPLPPSHVKVIFYLINNGSSSITDIALNLGISKPNMTPIIDKLLKDDLVFREEDPKDRRIMRIDLTKKAIDISNEHTKILKDLLLSKLSTLTDENLCKMEDLVSQLIDILSILK